MSKEWKLQNNHPKITSKRKRERPTMNSEIHVKRIIKEREVKDEEPNDCAM